LLAQIRPLLPFSFEGDEDDDDLCFLHDERAATSIEYGLIAAGIAVVIITVLKGVGSKLNTTFTTVQTALK
jgi:pilus assembly protein Flp/PilA